MSSAEELSMRVAVEAWGRARWPGCRVLHEFDVGYCRADLAFVTPDHLALVEIKSSRDVLDRLDRLDRQLGMFVAHAPEVWIAHARRWCAHIAEMERGPGMWRVGQILVEDGLVDERIPAPNGRTFPRRAHPDRTMTVPMLCLLLKPEIAALLARHGLGMPGRTNREALIERAARGLTGDQIVAGACRALRERVRGWAGDAPVLTAA